MVSWKRRSCSAARLSSYRAIPWTAVAGGRRDLLRSLMALSAAELYRLCMVTQQVLCGVVWCEGRED